MQIWDQLELKQFAVAVGRVVKSMMPLFKLRLLNCYKKGFSEEKKIVSITVLTVRCGF